MRLSRSHSTQRLNRDDFGVVAAVRLRWRYCGYQALAQSLALKNRVRPPLPLAGMRVNNSVAVKMFFSFISSAFSSI